MSDGRGPAPETPDPPGATPAPRRKPWLGWLLRLAVVGALAVWFLRGDGPAELWQAIGRLPPTTFAAAAALVLTAIGLTTFRWRWLMRGFGAARLPAYGRLWRLIHVGLFYNTFVPGAVGGDVVRGVVSRQAFDEPAAGLLVVFLDRLIGLSALAVLFLVGLPFAPEALLPVRGALPWIVGLAVAGVLALVLARHSGRLARIWSRVPRVRHAPSLALAFGISFLCHGLSLVAFGLLSQGLGLDLSVGTLLVVVPLGMVASFIPLALVGVGPREAALVGLLGLLGVDRGAALAFSLGYAGAVILAASLGGLLQLVGQGGLAAPDAPKVRPGER